RRLLRFSLITVTIISIIIYILIFFLAGPIAHLFNSENNPELQQIAIIGLELYFTAILFMGFNTITSTFFTSIERPIPAQIISVLKGLVIIIPMAILMSSLLGITGVWLSFPASEGIVAIVSLILILISRKAWGKHNSDNLLPITPVLIDPSRKN
ncbi:MAG: MATE family efflux transporter, partial [Clostridia bacterium]